MLDFIKQNTQKLSTTVDSTLKEANFQKYYSLLTQAEDEEERNLTQSEKIQRIINKASGITELEKKFIFEYSSNSPAQGGQSGDTLDKFAKNLIIVVNSFFEYGFEGSGHYWELLTEHFTSYSSVTYVNQQLQQTKSHEKALSWLILVFNEENVLFYCFHEIF